MHPGDNKRKNEEAAKSEQPAKQIRFDYDYDDIIIVLVGEEKIKFSVYKDIICEKSKFFNTACAPDRWLEGKEKTVSLPKVDPWTVQGLLSLGRYRQAAA
jgi:hypothetical protein